MAESTEDILVDHSLEPRNTEPLADSPTHESEVENPSCGDTLQLQLVIENNKVSSLRITPEGCAFSKASASLFSEFIVGKSLEEIATLSKEIADSLKSGSFEESLGELALLESLSKFPLRHRCVLLPFEAFSKALSKDN